LFLVFSDVKGLKTAPTFAFFGLLRSDAKVVDHFRHERPAPARWKQWSALHASGAQTAARSRCGRMFTLAIWVANFNGVVGGFIFGRRGCRFDAARPPV
jgi:hypothetical protein